MTISQKMQFILDSAREYPPISVAVVDAEEKYVLRGLLDAERHGLINPVLIGDADQICGLSNELGIDLSHHEIINASSEGEASEIGVNLVLEKKCHALAKGWIHTDVLMRAVVSHLRTPRRVSHVFLAELPSYHKLLFITDAAINIDPDLMTKVSIVQNAVDLAIMLGIEQPKVAALSAVEVVKPAIPSTLDAANLSVMAKRGQIKNAILDGPLAFDNAISKEAAKIKKIDSEVAGDVDILLAPGIDAANILAKDLEHLAGATMAGIVVGAQVPVLLSSRSDPPEGRLLSAALAVLMHYRWGTGTPP